MKCKFIYILSVFIIWNSQNIAQAQVDSFVDSEQTDEYVLTSVELYNCDYTRFENQLEALKTGNDLLKQRVEIMQLQLEKQENFLQGLEKKIDNIPQILQFMESNLKENFIEVNNLIGKQNQIIEENYQKTSFDNKLQLISDIKQIVEDHGNLIKTLTEKMSNVENELSKTSCENQTLQLGESISKNLTVLQNIDKRLEDIMKGKGNKFICTAQRYPTNCAEYNENDCANNKCRICNDKFGPKPFLVSCDNQTEGGGWTVIQRRINGSVDFYRNWTEYKDGFGNIDGEFFIGLDKLHILTTTLQPVELMIQLKDFNDTLKYAKYDEFIVGNDIDHYKLLKVGKYSGNAGDSFSQHQDCKFTTKDRDNDKYTTGNCAIDKKGAWWYENCLWSSLNGRYHDMTKESKVVDGIKWRDFHGYRYSMKFVQMMIRPKKTNT